MARYRPYNVKQDKFIAVSYAEQIVPGSFEHALNEIIEEHLDLTVFERRYRNDETTGVAGPAWDFRAPRMILVACVTRQARRLSAIV